MKIALFIQHLWHSFRGFILEYWDVSLPSAAGTGVFLIFDGAFLARLIQAAITTVVCTFISVSVKAAYNKSRKKSAKDETNE